MSAAAPEPATRSLEDRLELPTVGWKPEPGATLVGTVVSVGEREGDYGPYPTVTVETADADVVFHAYHTVARQEIEQLQPRTGDRIGIKYLGRHEPDGGGDGYEQYTIKLERAPAV